MSPVPIFNLVKRKNILLHAIRDASKENGSLNVGYTVLDGFYRFMQVNADGKPYDATITNPTSVGQTSLPVAMYNGTDLLPRVWKLTRQYGVTDGFTIVPVTDPIVDPPGLGVTTFDKNKTLVVEKSSCYPIWTIRCDERIDYRNPDGTITTIYLFRVLEVNSNDCWTTNNAEKVVINTATADAQGRPAANQLYQLILTPPVNIQNVQSVAQVVTTAVDANIVRKFYYGYTADLKKNYIALQLTTDARDQGWADHPESGLWSWFEIAILASAPATGSIVTTNQIKKDAQGNLCTWHSHSIPLTNQYTEQTGPVFDATHPLWANLKDGNVISVLVVAQFGAWEGDVRRGDLAIAELVEQPNPI